MRHCLHIEIHAMHRQPYMKLLCDSVQRFPYSTVMSMSPFLISNNDVMRGMFKMTMRRGRDQERRRRYDMPFMLYITFASCPDNNLDRPTTTASNKMGNF